MSSLKEAAAELGISYSSAWRAVRSGRLRFYRYHSGYSIEPADLELFRRACRNRKVPRRFVRMPLPKPPTPVQRRRQEATLVRVALRQVLADRPGESSH